MAETPNDPLLAFLREHAGRYSPEALRQHLLTQGYDAARIDAALDAYRREAPAAEGERPGTLALVGVILAVIAGVALLLAGTCGGIIGFVVSSESNNQAEGLAIFVGVIVVVVLGVTAIVSPIRWYRRRSARRTSPPASEKRP
ncbi:MAG TPA: hypothetical protein VMW75_22790 [Thermoanaerobaculia bacterium]|nr:hypothetical protein [Thermoanaerobaculia bacterium]